MEVIELNYYKLGYILSFFCLFLLPISSFATESGTSSITEYSAIERTENTIDPVSQPYDDTRDTRGIDSIPEGGITIDGLFDNPVGGTGFTIKNYVPNNLVNNGFPYSEITIGGKNNWISMWSLETNKLDFSQSFKGRMFVNFGTNQSDGFTFTMHNDPKKTQALTTAQNKKTDGQNLGVYGTNASSQGLFTTIYPNTDAIKNSFSVEFDLYKNGKESYPNAFDVSDNPLGELNAPHLAYTFPGNLNATYQPIDKSVLGNISDANGWFSLGLVGRSARIKHNAYQYMNNALKTQSVQDGTWYEFNFNFDFDKKEFTYSLRDPKNGAETSLILVPWNTLSSELELSVNDNKAYWGFTAANGASEGSVKMVFADAPVELQYALDNDVFNSEGENIVLETNGGNSQKFTKKGEDVSFKTTATLQNISYETTNLIYQASLTANQFDLTTLKEAKVSVNDQYLGSYVPTVDTKNNKFTLSIPATAKKGDHVTIDFKIESTIESASDELAKFTSSLLLLNIHSGNQDFISSMPVHFLLKHIADPITASWSNDTVTTTLTKEIDRAALVDTDYLLTFYYSGGTAGSIIHYKLVKDGQSLTDDMLSNESNTSTQKSKELQIPSSALAYGNNIVNLSVYEESNPNMIIQLTAIITVNGSLQVTQVPNLLSWTNLKIGETKGELARDAGNTIDLTVTDSRQQQTKDWYLSIATVTADPKALTSSNFVWKTLSGPSQQIPDKQSGNSLTIMDGTTASLNRLYDYQLHFKNTEGILLKNTEYLPIGTYKNKQAIQWTLNQVRMPD